ncbi:MAG: GH92 family glycosyl hydrolase [Flavobacteriales bacterium]|nr:GH92 family glycosyl hydrolase [Flavobacteriales bacterium]
MSIAISTSVPSARLRESVFTFLLLLSLLTTAQAPNPARDLVNPFIGTGGHGHTFPGACVPNGMVQISPDTRPDGVMDWDGCSGYHYSDSVIYGFSHTHLSGTGVADLCDVLLMPMSGTPSMDPLVYRSHFDHSSEKVHAGYYRAWLQDERTLAELTATARCGVHRYTMPPGEDHHVVIDLMHRDELLASSIRLDGQELVGERRSSSWARDQRLYFCIRFGAPQGKVEIAMGAARDSTKAIINVKSEGTSAFIVKVGISAVSIDGARKNLDTEVPDWDFNAVRKQAEDAWNSKLNRIEVQGGTKESQRIFYTALYHTYVAPYLFNDVDGKYRGMDGEVHHADHNVYTVFSLWDTYRALHPLMTILEPEMTSDWIKTFLLHYQQSGRLPVWELWGNETDCMIGYHSASVIADAYVKGIRGFDADLALEAMLASAMRDEPGLNAYRTKGYISSEDQSESVSKTLEYAYDDRCIAQMAFAMPREYGVDPERATYLDSIAHAFTVRSYNYQNLFDPRSGFFQARLNGGFKEPFDPFEVNFNFTEANAWQYSLAVQQGKQYLIDLFSNDGRTTLGDHLDALFTAESATTGREQSDITGLIGQYAHGNEPSHHMAYLYNAVGRPEKTAELVHRITSELYHDAPDGLSGNEDCGQMSAWYVLSAMGFYPVSPGIPWYEVGMTLFDTVRIDLGGGKAFTVQGRASNVRTGQGRMLDHAKITNGGTLDLASRNPDTNVADTTVSVLVSPNYRPSAVPFIQASSRAFKDSLRVTIDCLNGRSFNYRLNKGAEVAVPRGPVSFTIHGSATIMASNSASPVVAQFTKMEGDRTITLESAYANQYAAGGSVALIDGLRGGPDFRTGEWQGFEGQDVVAMIDLGKEVELKRVGLGALQDQKSWIWLPSEVTIATSTNQRQWSTSAIMNPVDPKVNGSLIHEFWSRPIDRKVRYIAVHASSAGPCPDWHPGKGGKAWIFVDEVLLETR